VIATIVLLLAGIMVILPLIIPWFFVFKTQLEYAYHPWSLPTRLYLNNFRDAWKSVQLAQGLMNTFYLCFGAIACTILPSAFAGYVFARYKSVATEIVFYAVLIGYFIPAQMVLIPLYKMSVSMKIVDSIPGVFLPISAFGISFWALIYRSFFRNLPKELADAAHIDGAGHSATFFRIMFPLAQPATMLALLLVFIGCWGDYMLSLVLLSDQNHFTMQLRVAQFLNQYGVSKMPKYAAAALISAAPTVILYLIGHRWIIQGALAGAIKE